MTWEWSDREANKNINFTSEQTLKYRDNVLFCSRKIALYMYKERRRYLEPEELNQFMQEFQLNEFELKNRSLLFPLNDNAITFAHQSFYEYFLACAVFKDLEFCAEWVDLSQLEDALAFYVDMCEVQKSRQEKSVEGVLELSLENLQPNHLAGIQGGANLKIFVVSDGKKQVFSTVSSDTGYGLLLELRKITELNLSGFQLNDKESKNLRFFIGVEDLNLSKNRLTKLDWLLRSQPPLQKLNLDWNPLTEIQILKLHSMYAKLGVIDVWNSDGHTLLSLAVKEQDRDKVMSLLNKGASYQKANVDGRTAYSIAWQNGYKEILQIFYEKGLKWQVAVIDPEKQTFEQKLDKLNQKNHFIFQSVITANSDIVFFSSNSDDGQFEHLAGLLAKKNILALYVATINNQQDVTNLYSKANFFKQIETCTEEEIRKRLDEFLQGSKALQQMTGYVHGRVESDTIDMTFNYIPEGTFQMGLSDKEEKATLELMKKLDYSEDDTNEQKGWMEWEKPSHTVEITKPFYMAEYLVRVKDFRKFVEEKKHTTEAEKGDGAFGLIDGSWKQDKKFNWKEPGFKQTDEDPVVCISWNDANEFINWLNRKEAGSGRKYQLPTEAQWEYAARAGTEGLFYWGDGEPQMNCADETTKKEINFNYWWKGYGSGYVYTSSVGSFQPNAFGLYDMLGNVWEWCEDEFDEKKYEKGFVSEPEESDSDKLRVIRGGSWFNDPVGCRVSGRSRDFPGSRDTDRGFRLIILL